MSILSKLGRQFFQLAHVDNSAEAGGLRSTTYGLGESLSHFRYYGLALLTGSVGAITSSW